MCVFVQIKVSCTAELLVCKKMRVRKKERKDERKMAHEWLWIVDVVCVVCTCVCMSVVCVCERVCMWGGTLGFMLSQ